MENPKKGTVNKLFPKEIFEDDQQCECIKDIYVTGLKTKLKDYVKLLF